MEDNTPIQILVDAQTERLTPTKKTLVLIKEDKVDVLHFSVTGFYTVTLLTFLTGAMVAFLASVIIVAHWRPATNSITDMLAQPNACNPRFSSDCGSK